MATVHTEKGKKMAEYIERKAAIDVIMSEPTDAHYPSWYADKIKSISAADVAPVRHGRWKLNKHYGDYECSVCGNGDVISLFFYTLKMKYCPNCGAKMDGDNDA